MCTSYHTGIDIFKTSVQISHQRYLFKIQPEHICNYRRESNKMRLLKELQGHLRLCTLS